MSETLLLPKTRETSGQWLSLPKNRRLVVDLLTFSMKVPSQPLVRNCNLGELVRLRREISPRISWPAMFMRAYALMAERNPPLRQIYMPWPWAHIHEHPYSIGRMTVAREYEGEEWVFFARVVRPESLSLVELQELMLETKNLPIEEIPRFRLQAAFSKFPTPLRRLAWWISLFASGYMRATRLGTFSVTTVSSLGAISIHPPSLGSMMMSYGPISSNGDVRVTLCYDHRLLDGAKVARYLEELEATLNGEIAEELHAMKSCPLPRVA